MNFIGLYRSIFSKNIGLKTSYFQKKKFRHTKFRNKEGRRKKVKLAFYILSVQTNFYKNIFIRNLGSKKSRTKKGGKKKFLALASVVNMLLQKL